MLSLNQPTEVVFFLLGSCYMHIFSFHIVAECWHKHSVGAYIDKQGEVGYIIGPMTTVTKIPPFDVSEN